MARWALMVMGDASTVTLPDILVDVLREHRKSALELRMQLGAGRLPDDALLFSTINGGPLSPTVVSTAWGELADRIGMPEVTFHWNSVAPYIRSAIRYLNVTANGRQWIANLYSNVFRAEHDIALGGPQQ
jgi:hypothetical protein